MWVYKLFIETWTSIVKLSCFPKPLINNVDFVIIGFKFQWSWYFRINRASNFELIRILQNITNLSSNSIKSEWSSLLQIRCCFFKCIWVQGIFWKYLFTNLTWVLWYDIIFDVFYFGKRSILFYDYWNFYAIPINIWMSNVLTGLNSKFRTWPCDWVNRFNRKKRIWRVDK